MRLGLRIVALLLMALVPSFGQYVIKKGSKLYIEKMENDLDGYIVAEIVKKKLAVEVVQDGEAADYIMLGSGTSEQSRKWHQGWLTAEQDRTTGNIKVVEKSTKKLVFAGEAGDRSLWWGSMARGGQRKVASRLVGKLKDHIK